jgi:hypothetical protein
MYAAMVSNDPLASGPAATTVDELEQATNLDFFAALEDSEEEALESGRSGVALNNREPDRQHRSSLDIASGCAYTRAISSNLASSQTACLCPWPMPVLIPPTPAGVPTRPSVRP